MAKRAEQGVALLTVLWVVALLSVMVGGFSYLVRTELLLVRNQGQALQARLAAEAGVALALRQLLASEEQLPWRLDGERHAIAMGRGRAEAGMRDVSGLIDLNHADPSLFDALLNGLGVAPAERSRLIDLMLDWRDDDDLVRLHGGEQRDYLAAGLNYAPRNGPFQRIDELEWVPGFSPELVRRLSPHLTLHSGQAGLNPAVASAELLELLLGDPREVRHLVEDRELGGSAYLALRGQVGWPLAGLSGTVEIDASGWSGGGAQAGLRVVARGNGGSGYQLLSWDTASGYGETGVTQ